MSKTAPVPTTPARRRVAAGLVGLVLTTGLLAAPGPAAAAPTATAQQSPTASANPLGGLGATLQQLVATLLGLGGGQPPSPPPTVVPPDQADGVEAVAQDVFVIVGSTLRHPDETTPADRPLFNVGGVGLDLTWGEWSAAIATSAVRTTAGESPSSDVEQHFIGLVPGGVYSVFWGTLNPDSENPLCPGVERTLPLTSIDPDQSPDASSFVAAADGTATFRGHLAQDLFDASQVYFSLVYHFDGQTWGSLPNRGEFETQGPQCRSSFGEDAMRQLLILQKW